MMRDNRIFIVREPTAPTPVMRQRLVVTGDCENAVVRFHFGRQFGRNTGRSV